MRRSFPDLASFEGKLIAAQAGSLQENYVQTQLPQATLETITSMDIGILSLTTNKVNTPGFRLRRGQRLCLPKDNSLILADARFDTTLEDKHAGNVLAVKKGETELIAGSIALLRTLTKRVCMNNGKTKPRRWLPSWALNSMAPKASRRNRRASSRVGKIPHFHERLVGNLEAGGDHGFLWHDFRRVDRDRQAVKESAAEIHHGGVRGSAARGTPILVQLYIFRFFLPMAFPWLNLLEDLPASLSRWSSIVSAYVAEIIRSGIQAVDKGQSEAAKSLGMSRTGT